MGPVGQDQRPVGADTAEHGHRGTAMVARGGVGGKGIGDVTTEGVHRWINRADDPSKPSIRLFRLSWVKSFIRYCVLKRYILTDPAQLVTVDFKLMTHNQRVTRHKPVFQDKEVEFLLAQSEDAEPPSITPGCFRAAITLGRDLALRLGDICNLEWSSLRYLRRVATVWTDKSNTRVEIPLTPRVIRLIARLPADDQRYVFPDERALANDTERRAGLSVAFGRFFQRCGFEGYSFHCLRATYATTLAQQGLSLDEIAEKLGHKSSQTTRAYVRKPKAAQVAVRG